MTLAQPEMDAASRARVFFGHQSVGQNILDGIRDLIGPRPLAWVDALIGQNERPATKLDAFHAAVTEGTGKDAEFALIKFCYIDFNARTDVPALFEAYKKTMARIAVERPRTAVIHFTVPLTTVASGPKAWVKRRLGAAVWGELENEKRHAFNVLLRGEYRERDVFDLARIEAGEPENPQRYELRGEAVPMLWSGYTDDGGHLNAKGRRVAAEELLRFVANRERV